jgi:hypothetical protein
MLLLRAHAHEVNICDCSPYKSCQKVVLIEQFKNEKNSKVLPPYIHSQTMNNLLLKFFPRRYYPLLSVYFIPVQ